VGSGVPVVFTSPGSGATGVFSNATIYDPSYAGDMADTFGDDATAL
jgi:hypothetical protein